MMIMSIVLLGMVMADGCPIEHVSIVNGSCCEVKSSPLEFKFSFSRSHVYNIVHFCGDCKLTAEGYCDAYSAGGGWLVIQRRQDGSVDFNKNWADYENGFGSLTGEFWYGLRAIHCLTSQRVWQMRIDYTFTDGTKGYLSYSNFRVWPATEKYKLSISGYSGVTSDPFSTVPINGMKFTTRDKDNSIANCAVAAAGGVAGGWWYNNCAHIYPNHQFHRLPVNFSGKVYVLKFMEIKIKPKQCIV